MTSLSREPALHGGLANYRSCDIGAQVSRTSLPTGNNYFPHSLPLKGVDTLDNKACHHPSPAQTTFLFSRLSKEQSMVKWSVPASVRYHDSKYDYHIIRLCHRRVSWQDGQQSLPSSAQRFCSSDHLACRLSCSGNILTAKEDQYKPVQRQNQKHHKF